MKLFNRIVARCLAAIVGVTAVSFVESASSASTTARHRTRRAAPAAFGPAGCVSLSQSNTGTCVLTTGCEGHDISKVEFAFDCEGGKNKDIIRHSFGVGGFDADEEFDTEVKCHICSLPTPEDEVVFPSKLVPTVEKQTKTPMQKEHENKVNDQAPKQVQEQAQKEWATALRLQRRTLEQNAQIRYGPKDCVSTYRSSEGHCMMVTDCTPIDIKDYEFGLVCVDKAGSPVRHLFGKDSFDPQETFDTLITCDRCLGLEDVPGDVALVGQVAALSKEVAGLKGMMTNLTADIARLEGTVFSDEAQASDNDIGAVEVAASVEDGADRQSRHLRATAKLVGNSRRHTYDAQQSIQHSKQRHQRSVRRHNRRQWHEKQNGNFLHQARKHIRQRLRVEQETDDEDGDQGDMIRDQRAQRPRIEQEDLVGRSEEGQADDDESLGEEPVIEALESDENGDNNQDVRENEDTFARDFDGSAEDN